jgi:hypothetical protein
MTAGQFTIADILAEAGWTKKVGAGARPGRIEARDLE